MLLYFKQVGGLHPTSGGDELDIYWQGYPRRWQFVPTKGRAK